MAAAIASAIPVAVATTAIGAYLNAKLKVSNDFVVLGSLLRAQRKYDKLFAEQRGNLFYRLEEHASNKNIADKIFLVYENKTWTFKQAYDRVLQYACWLHRAHHVVSGEIVAVDLMNSAAFVFLTIALWSLGASPAFINYNLTGKPLIHSVRISTARLLIVDPDLESDALTPETNSAFLAEDFRNGAFPLELCVLREELQKSIDYYPKYRAPDAARNVTSPASMACLMYTSGTTGLPKAAIVPWMRQCVGGGLCAGILGLRSVDKKNPDRFYTCMPLYHTTGFTLGFNPCLQTATTLVIGRKFSVSKFWEEVRFSKTTIVQYVGETLRYLLAAPVTAKDRDHSVRMAFGNGLRKDVWADFKSRFGIPTVLEVYGATEGVSATWNLNRNSFTDGAIGSYGKILEFMAGRNQAIVKVDWITEKPWRDPKTRLCQQVARGQVGELLFALDPESVEERFVGYLNNKEASDSKLVRDVLSKGDVYFRTGDVIRFDSDGRMWFADRIGDTFRWKSENVSTAEVSEAIGTHAVIQDANVYGVSVPGHEGRAGCAALLLDDSALLKDGKAMKVRPEILESFAVHARSSLPKYAVPLFLRIVPEVTLTGNNKQQKNVLRNQGIDLNALRQSGSTDSIYWLKPGTSTYVPFEQADLHALEAGKVKL